MDRLYLYIYKDDMTKKVVSAELTADRREGEKTCSAYPT